MIKMSYQVHEFGQFRFQMNSNAHLHRRFNRMKLQFTDFLSD